MIIKRRKSVWYLNCLIVEREYENHLLGFGYSDEEVENVVVEEAQDFINNLTIEESFGRLIEVPKTTKQ